MAGEAGKPYKETPQRLTRAQRATKRNLTPVDIMPTIGKRGALLPETRIDDIKAGRYHRQLRGGLREAYERTAIDPERLGLESELALLDAATSDLAAHLSRLAEAAEDGQAGVLARAELASLRRDVAAMVAARAKLSESAAKLAGLLSPLEVAEFGQRLVTLVLRHVPEPDRRQAIARDFEGLMVGDRSVYQRLPVDGARLGT